MGNGVKAMAMSVVLNKADKDYKNNLDIKWYFTKFVIYRDGNVVARFEPTESMKELEKLVSSLI